MTDFMQEAIDHVLRLRGVEDPCEKCHGLGVRSYPSGATWRGGMGTATSLKDVCDTCWGTGDKGRHGVDLRKQEREEEERVKARALGLIAHAVGANLDAMRAGILGVATELEALPRAKNKPRPPWFSLVAEQLARLLREGVEAARKREAK